MKFEDKFHLSAEESRFLAKKKWDENIYCGMRMENRAVTFPQTQTILNGVNVPNVQLDDIQAILNMRDAWRFLLDSLENPLTLDYICTLNGYIARNEALSWGKLRTGSVGISGTDYLPSVPDFETASIELQAIIENDTTVTDKALILFLWGVKGQLFWNGNKRTSMTAANKLLLAAGAGMLTIQDKDMEQFNALLLDYYSNDNQDTLKEFLYDNCIQGIVFE
ncbi:MAG: Fic family protein [Ruminococcus sp.]|nr:Fic family protein [Ruminococcus sp.]